MFLSFSKKSRILRIIYINTDIRCITLRIIYIQREFKANEPIYNLFVILRNIVNFILFNLANNIEISINISSYIRILIKIKRPTLSKIYITSNKKQKENNCENKIEIQFQLGIHSFCSLMLFIDQFVY